MNKYILSILLVLATSAKAQPLQFEAGLSHVHVTGADYEHGPAPFTISEDQSTWAPYVGVRTWLSSKVALRAAYQVVPELEATLRYRQPQPGEFHLPVLLPEIQLYRDKIQMVTFGPQFHFQVRPSLLLIISPEASWVRSRGKVHYIFLDSSREFDTRNDSKVTLGGSVSLNYALDSHWSVEFGYRFVDADPSRNRKLHMFSGGLLFKF